MYYVTIGSYRDLLWPNEYETTVEIRHEILWSLDLACQSGPVSVSNTITEIETRLPLSSCCMWFGVTDVYFFFLRWWHAIVPKFHHCYRISDSCSNECHIKVLLNVAGGTNPSQIPGLQATTKISTRKNKKNTRHASRVVGCYVFWIMGKYDHEFIFIHSIRESRD